MALRTALVMLVVAATATFVVGVSIERGNEPAHEIGGQALHVESGAGAERRHLDEGGHKPEATATHQELRPLGIDVEAWPFVATAALASLALAAAAWLRPRQLGLLMFVAAAMIAFAALDLREVFHQADADESGLASLAGVVAILHLAAGAVAGTLATRARPNAPPGRTDTMPA